MVARKPMASSEECTVSVMSRASNTYGTRARSACERTTMAVGAFGPPEVARGLQASGKLKVREGAVDESLWLQAGRHLLLQSMLIAFAAHSMFSSTGCRSGQVGNDYETVHAQWGDCSSKFGRD